MYFLYAFNRDYYDQLFSKLFKEPCTSIVVLCILRVKFFLVFCVRVSSPYSAMEYCAIREYIHCNQP